VCNDEYAGANACLFETPKAVESALAEMTPWALGVAAGVGIMTIPGPITQVVGALFGGISAARLASLMIDNGRAVFSRLGSKAVIASLGLGLEGTTEVLRAVVNAPVSFSMSIRSRAPTRAELAPLLAVRNAVTKFQTFWRETLDKVGLTIAPPDAALVAGEVQDFIARAPDLIITQVRGSLGYTATLEASGDNGVAIRLEGPPPGRTSTDRADAN